MSSVGVGSGWILNLPPTVTGQIPEQWAAPAIAFGQALNASFSTPVASLLKANATVECGPNAPPLILPIPAGKKWNAVRTSEDVYHNGQLVFSYQIDALGGGFTEADWVNVTSRGGSVGVGTVDLTAGLLSRGSAGEIGSPGEVDGATKLRWRCLGAKMGRVTLSSVDLYMATPPS